MSCRTTEDFRKIGSIKILSNLVGEIFPNFSLLPNLHSKNKTFTLAIASKKVRISRYQNVLVSSWIVGAMR